MAGPARRITTLVITGGETDVCVLATVMAAVDLGFRIVPADGRALQYPRRHA